ncbi:DUF2332 family protein [Modestobacter sp. I12A-02628]|uniref:DUF2332 domain-containing protein n=1 Tax=Goekera deserti TaxID=2497753 RepID=A0A7K3WKQ3_9ACTN|nr:DUF2332 domain-containing protein [Goekera deserti]MPQ96644.1 DUF2332 family protein [Goekera deserti]NDI47044.1 DUF2332 family protein [Goekera deserti]NEL56280.1 DUF2332 domain-containing protein [Goekera deserti]
MKDSPAAGTAERYRDFSREAAAAHSPGYAALSTAIAEDPTVLAFLDALPPRKRQPNLFFGALRYLHGHLDDAAQLRRWVVEDADLLRATMLARATQTNEPARCTALLPLLAALPQPIGLIEVGASAGLCLYPDRYGYDYDGVPVGPPSPVHLSCATSGPVPVPAQLPTVAARVGVDLNPLDPADPDTRAWLEALIWPEHTERRERLGAALDLAAAEPAQMLRGDLLYLLPEAVAALPAGCTPVVVHTAVLTYLPPPARDDFVALVGELGVRWISQEGPQVLPGIAARLTAEVGPADFVLALDGEPVAVTAPHGGRVDWLGRAVSEAAAPAR